ncbi:MAG TPA: aminotransferase class I/II-fold pyridoxal phosphate-dependent enzyme, partial [Burkholderiaceae bacterium]|nr:aminotransferase class I/II-fold pyridoxal phosphate-dependent enzyme [Burkholderiaceae bacterium]
MNEMPEARIHGGPDADGPERWDFSTCANAAGPCPAALDAVLTADPTRYPDPHHHGLREGLAALHRVEPRRIVIAASASEFVQRITAIATRLRPGPVGVPRHAYGDYAASARAWGRSCRHDDEPGETLSLQWCTDPSSPLGLKTPIPCNAAAVPTVLDSVYAPLRLKVSDARQSDLLDQVFVLHSPNKALGLCGVRGAYAIAPREATWDANGWLRMLQAAEPSWPLGTHGAAMLAAWTDAPVRQWVQQSHARLSHWKTLLIATLVQRGFTCLDSDTPFFCARPPMPTDPLRLRHHGVAVRDAASFGLCGWWRLSAQPPLSIAQLAAALDHEGSRS